MKGGSFILATSQPLMKPHSVPVVYGDACLPSLALLRPPESDKAVQSEDYLIERGILIALDEINRAGGVLGGRPLQLISKDNRSVTARGVKNLKEFAQTPDLVAMFVGRFSPVVLEYVDLAHQLEMIVLDPWAAADAITQNGKKPNYIFRLSLRDGLAMPAMLKHALGKGAGRVGLLLPNTSWGRSNLASAERYFHEASRLHLVGIEWYQWGDKTMLDKYQALRAAGAHLGL